MIGYFSFLLGVNTGEKVHPWLFFHLLLTSFFLRDILVCLIFGSALHSVFLVVLLVALVVGLAGGVLGLVLEVVGGVRDLFLGVLGRVADLLAELAGLVAGLALAVLDPDVVVQCGGISQHGHVWDREVACALVDFEEIGRHGNRGELE